MKVVNENGQPMTQIDLTKGELVLERKMIARHEAVDGVAPKYHYAVIKEYDNGGKDMQLIIDEPGVEAKAAWDEYEEFLRFVTYKN